jgi:hypothetical protein
MKKLLVGLLALTSFSGYALDERTANLEFNPGEAELVVILVKNSPLVRYMTKLKSCKAIF